MLRLFTLTISGNEVTDEKVAVGERKVAVILPLPCTEGFQLQVAESDALGTEAHPPILLLLNLKVTSPSSLKEVEIVIGVPLKAVFTFPVSDKVIVGGAGVH